MASESPRSIAAPAQAAAAGASPRASYEQRRDQRRARKQELQHRHETLGAGKVVAFFVFLATFIWTLNAGWHAAPWIAPPLAALIALARWHERAVQALERARRAEAYFQTGLDRLDGRWVGQGRSGEGYAPAAHPYARDLDIVGRGSLFELLCTARTEPGQATLAAWLLAPAEPASARARQQTAQALRDALELREALGTVPAADEDATRRPETLAEWAGKASWALASWQRGGALALAVLWVAALGLWIATYFALPFFVISLVNLIVWGATRRRADELADAAEWAGRGAANLATVIGILAAEPAATPKLIELRAALSLDDLAAPARLFELDRWVRWTGLRHDLFFRVADPFLLWSRQHLWRIEAWRGRWGAQMPRLLAALGEYEALLAISGYLFEHPEDTFPEFDSRPGASFEARGLAHPLLPEACAVRNHLSLGEDLRLAIVSGPNMAGKSTLLRAVGVNAVLAQCGAPVRACALRLSPLRVAASVCVLDSLQGGISRFYAELLRLKAIAELARGPVPVLFLLDELMQGTNASDRRQGAEAVARELLTRGAIGLITTHDAAIVEMADKLGAPAACFHFEDWVENGELRFDYRLSPGPAHEGNALLLMRSLGLPV